MGSELGGFYVSLFSSLFIFLLSVFNNIAVFIYFCIENVSFIFFKIRTISSLSLLLNRQFLLPIFFLFLEKSLLIFWVFFCSILQLFALRLFQLLLDFFCCNLCSKNLRHKIDNFLQFYSSILSWLLGAIDNLVLMRYFTATFLFLMILNSMLIVYQKKSNYLILNYKEITKSLRNIGSLIVKILRNILTNLFTHSS